MSGDRTVDRRTVLQTLGAAAVVSVSTAGTAAGGGGDHTGEGGAGDHGPDGGHRSDTGEGSPKPEGILTGLYNGTVDRVVDGEHVVILVESGGTVIDQQVVSASEYPSLGPGDPVSLFFLFGSLLALWPAS